MTIEEVGKMATTLRKKGVIAEEIADTLNEKGARTVTGKKFSKYWVNNYFSRRGMSKAKTTKTTKRPRMETITVAAPVGLPPASARFLAMVGEPQEVVQAIERLWR